MQAIDEADAIILGPGSLYTSVMPNLLIDKVADHIANSKAAKIYICNVMTQPGETVGYTVGQHLEALMQVVGKGVIGYVLANKQEVNVDTLSKYVAAGSTPVKIDEEKVEQLGAILITADLLGETAGAIHDSDVLANELISIRNLLHASINTDSLKAYLKGN